MAELTVSDVLAMPVLREAGPTVLAGSDGLDRTVRWVHSAELADIAPLLREGDLLLSTGIAMPDTGDALAEFATSLAETDAAGLVIELGRRWRVVPASLVAACGSLGLPLVSLAHEVKFAAVAQLVGERLVSEQLAELREAQRVHDTFTELSIAEAGPDEVLEAVQRLSGTAVVLESEQHRVLDYRAGPEDVTFFLANWAARSRSVALEGRTAWDPTNGWLVTRVGKRDRGWGRLILQHPSRPSARVIAMVERAAAALALHRLHDRQRDSAIRRTHHELVLGLLADPTSPELLRRCELAGLPIERRQFVGLTLRPVVESSGVGPASGTRMEEVIAATVHAAHELRAPALVCEVDRDARALLSCGASTDTRRVVDELAARVRRRLGVVVGSGRPVSRTSEIDRTLKEAQHVVQSVRPGAKERNVHRLEDVHVRGLIAMLRDDERVQMFADRQLDKLRQHDDLTGAGLVDAVRALVNHPTSKSGAAASLRLSRPAFYDRLAKAEKILGARLDDPDIRVSLHVAMIVDEMAQNS